MNIDQNKIFVIAGPSGVGKDTVMRELEKLGLPLERVITTASRPMRPGESQGHPYYFVSTEKFEAMISNQEFVEHANVFNNHKGITKVALEKVLGQDKGVLIQMEYQGAKTIKKLYPGATIIIIAPPTIKALNQRLTGRSAKMVETELSRRLAENQHWVKDYAEFEHIIENPTGHPEVAAAKIAVIIRSQLARG